jgi:hypothetical protein
MVHAEYRLASAVESTSNIAYAAHPGLPSSCGNAPAGGSDDVAECD